MATDKQPPNTAVHDERVVYAAAPWLSVGLADITTPDGVDRTHHAIRLNTVAIVTALDDCGRALLSRRHRWIVGQVGLESPGGIVEPGEDPEHAARHEFLEETGYEVAGELVLVANIEPMPGLVETRHYVYIATSPKRVGDPTDLEEDGVLEWIPVRDTPQLLATGQLLGTGTAVGMLSAMALQAGRAADSLSDQAVPLAKSPGTDRTNSVTS